MFKFLVSILSCILLLCGCGGGGGSGGGAAIAKPITTPETKKESPRVWTFIISFDNEEAKSAFLKDNPRITLIPAEETYLAVNPNLDILLLVEGSTIKGNIGWDKSGQPYSI